ncbi:hypothetical protein IWW45_009535, partial [Coemansia sp. RSA 485]
ATKHVDSKNEPHKANAALVSIKDRTTGQMHSLVFGRVRVSGTVVFQCRIDINGSEENVFFIDDSTGIIPFVLQTHAFKPRTADADSEPCQEANKVMSRRLEVESTSANNFLLVGKTIEVLGSMQWSVLKNDLWSFPMWIEGCQVNIKSEPMSETQALLETLDVYRFYFPRYSAFSNSR